MINFRIKIDDKEIYKMIKKQPTAVLSVGFWDDMYEGIEKGFYSSYGLGGKNTGKSRRYSPKKPISVAEVAAANEFGGGHRPPRPFMRWTLKNRARKWRKVVADILPQYAHDLKKVMSVLGEIAAEDLADTIKIWTRPPNAPSTVKKKGFNDPLVDSGQMMNGVRWKVE